MPTFSIQVDTHNRDLYFPPIQDKLRGAFDATAIDLNEVRRNWGFDRLPGQIVTVDTKTCEATIVEPLHKDTVFVAKLAARGKKLAPATVTKTGIDVDRWAFYMKAAVDQGKAKLIEGKFPDINYDPAVEVAQPSRQGKTLDAVLALLVARLTPEEKSIIAGLTT